MREHVCEQTDIEARRVLNNTGVQTTHWNPSQGILPLAGTEGICSEHGKPESSLPFTDSPTGIDKCQDEDSEVRAIGDKNMNARKPTSQKPHQNLNTRAWKEVALHTHGRKPSSLRERFNMGVNICKAAWIWQLKTRQRVLDGTAGLHLHALYDVHCSKSGAAHKRGVRQFIDYSTLWPKESTAKL